MELPNNDGDDYDGRLQSLQRLSDEFEQMITQNISVYDFPNSRPECCV